MPIVVNPRTGKTFNINAADVPAWAKAGYTLKGQGQEASKPGAAQPQAAPAQQPRALPLTLRDNLAQGITKNSDELAGAGRAAMGAVADKAHELATGKHTPLTPKLDYTAGRDAMRSKLSQDAATRPLASAAAKLAGGVMGGVAAMQGGVPWAAAYGASEGIGEAPELNGAALKAGAMRGATDGAIAGLVPGGRAASVLAKAGPSIWMRRMGATPGKLGFETLSEAKAALGQLFEKNPSLLKSRNLEEFLGAAKGAKHAAGQAMGDAYAAREGAPTATRAQLYAEIEKALEHMPQVKEKFMANVARSADKDRFVQGIQAAQQHYGYSPVDAESFATDLLKGDHTPMPAEEVQSWLNELKKVASPKGQAAAEIEAHAPGQVVATKAAHANATNQFNAALDPASLEARKNYGPAADLASVAAAAAKKETPGTIIPHGSTLPAMAKSALGSAQTTVMGNAQRMLQSPTAQGVVGGAAIGGLPTAASHFANIAKGLGVLDIPDATERAARDLLLQERHGDYSDARREAAKEHDIEQAQKEAQSEKKPQ